MFDGSNKSAVAIAQSPLLCQYVLFRITKGTVQKTGRIIIALYIVLIMNK